MNEKMAYEQIIAGKLSALPLPDMADAIWARIETELDLELPQDPSSDAGSTPKFPTGGTIIGGLSILFVIVFVAFFMNNKKQKTTPDTNLQPTTVTQPKQKENETFFKKEINKTTPTTNAPTQAARTTLPMALDSNSTTLKPVQTVADSSISNLPIAITPLPTPLKQDTVQTTKKGRGVSGIKDDDYRIVPKKDSTNKKN